MFLPLELTLRPSRLYPAVLLPACALAATGVVLANLPAWAKFAAGLVLLVGGIHAWRKRLPKLRSLRISQSGQLSVLLDDWQAANIKGQVVVLPWLISLTLILENGAAEKLLLWPDSAEADALRKLRVWLKWGQNSPSLGDGKG